MGIKGLEKVKKTFLLLLFLNQKFSITCPRRFPTRKGKGLRGMTMICNYSSKPTANWGIWSWQAVLASPFSARNCNQQSMPSQPRLIKGLYIIVIHWQRTACKGAFCKSFYKKCAPVMVTSNAAAPSSPGLTDHGAGFVRAALSFIITSCTDVLPLQPAWWFPRTLQQDSIDQRVVGMLWVCVVCNREAVCVMRADAQPQKHPHGICHLINTPFQSLHVQFFQKLVFQSTLHDFMNVSLTIYYQKLFILYTEALKKMFILFVERSKWYCRGSCWYSLYIQYLFGKAKSIDHSWQAIQDNRCWYL